MEITQKTKQPLLSRMSVTGTLVFDSKTPSNADVKKGVASATKTDENLVVIKHIYNTFGAKKAFFEAYVYDDEASLSAIEPKPKKKAEGAK